ncbi:MAG: isochorismate synthase [Microthrixaceae bacterium]
MTRLTAHSSSATSVPPVPRAGDSISGFSSPRRELVGLGCALRVEVPAPWCDNLGSVSAALEEIDGDADVLAFGALPYDRHSAASFVVPALTHVRTADGDRWQVSVEGAEAAATASSRGVPTAASEMTVRSVEPPEKWCASVAAARERIRAGELVKVVLSRRIEITADVDFDAATLWNRLREVNPAALCFAVDGFVGASPELLVSRLGETVRAQPMAGTTRRTGHPELDQRRAGELLASDKNRVEHQITIDAVHDALLGWCSYLDAEPSPSVVPAGPVQHLATVVEGHLSSPQPSVLELVAALHPTPAVGGHPTDTALALQRELESGPRGRYAGPVGWVDGRGNGAFAVGIRSVSLEGRHAELHAGVGVVADSEPEAELAETRAKAQALLSTLVRI